MNWRSEQIRQLDDDYDAYRRESQSKFNSEFDTWRSSRNQNGKGGQRQDRSEDDQSPRMPQDQNEKSRSKARTGKSSGAETKGAAK